QKGLVELCFEGLQRKDRNRGVQLPDFVAQHAVRRGRVDERSHVEHCAVLPPVGYENLPMNALARSFVQRVGDDTDDLDGQVGVSWVAKPDVLSYSAAARKEVLREATIHNRDARIAEACKLP